MSKSETKKPNVKIKNRLNKELSMVQLLYLVNKYNLEYKADIKGGIYEYKLASLLSEHIGFDDIDDVISDVSSINEELIDLEIDLRLHSKSDLKHILRDVDAKIYSSFDLLVKEVFLFVSLDQIKKELEDIDSKVTEKDNTEGRKEARSADLKKDITDGKKEVGSVDVKKDNADGRKEAGSVDVKKDSPKKNKPKSLSDEEIYDEISIYLKSPSKTENDKKDKQSKDLVSSKESEEKDIKKAPNKNKIEDVVSLINPNRVFDNFQFNQENIASKLAEYNLNFLCDMLLNNKVSIESAGLNEEDLKQMKNYSYKLDDLSEEEFKKQISDGKEKIIDIIVKNIPIDDLNKQYFNPIAYEYFPYGESFKEARSYQIETISQIYNAIEEGYKYIFLEACSGFGKSLIANTISRIYSKGKSYILTPTNQLLTPYEETFNKYKLKKVKARNFSKCKYTRNRKPCSYALCREFNCRYFKNLNLNEELSERTTCNYLYQLYEGLNSNTIVCTYDYFFTEAFRQKNFLTKRKLIICDEGHNIDNLASSGSSLMLYSNSLIDLGFDVEEEYDDLLETEDYYYFLLKVQHRLKEKLEDEIDQFSNSTLMSKDLFKVNNFLNYFEEGDNNIAFDHVEMANGNNRWIFRPIKTSKFISDVLFDYCDVCIFMSSSIFDYESFANDLGIDESEIFKLEVEPIFDLSKNPVKVYKKFNMEYDNLKEIKYNTLPIIDEILYNHRFEKGIIHAFSDECKEFLYENLKDQRRLITHTMENREEKLEEFKNSSRPLVFVSSSMDEGVDLPGDQCRFQIIFKLPFPNSQDYRIGMREATYEDGEEWYRYKMLTRLIQAYGRGIRYEGDYCQTYLLDNRIWDELIKDYNGDRIIPQYFLDVLEEYDRFEDATIPDTDEDGGEDSLAGYLEDYI